ncbi:unnamed protein product [Fraxinus pennsylvanica]|uniref:Uncharacterized protein n=1 Tax=Fraxinus pennsylvanica TaxID=56036 RepID=A0AAD1ZM57_9LAMI|nr:unnamed protein product [Fraxinus pennsylvanica]
MRGKSSSKKRSAKNGGIEVKVDEMNQEPHLSGAYIRSLVKQLTSSRLTKDSAHPKLQESLVGEGISSTKMADEFSERVQESPHQEQKKQVRRRLHTSRPYQERLLNMAEARREIVTALKFHRAAMKQASKQQQHQQCSRLSLEHESLQKNVASVTDFSNFEDNFSYSSEFCPPYNPYTWGLSPTAPPVLVQENMNFPLPNQTLGLNLNFHDFRNLDTIPYHNNNNPSIYSFSSPSSSSSFSLPLLTPEVIPSMAATSQEGPSVVATDVADLGLHQAMDDNEMAEIRSIGEQHQMEFNDTLNLVNSAWWFEFLNAMEIGPAEKSEDYGAFPFDVVMEFPAWLNANESCLQNLNDYYSEEYLQDSTLPR